MSGHTSPRPERSGSHINHTSHPSTPTPMPDTRRHGTSSGYGELNPNTPIFQPFSKDVGDVSDLVTGISQLTVAASKGKVSTRQPSEQARGQYGAIGDHFVKSNARGSINSSTASPSSRHSEQEGSPPSSQTSYEPHTSPSAPSTDNISPSRDERAYHQAEPSVRADSVIGSAEAVGRHLMISPLPKDTQPEALRAALGEIAHFKAIIHKHLQAKGTIFLTFYDPREAFKLFQRLQSDGVRLEGKNDIAKLQCMKVEKEVIEQIMSGEQIRREMWAVSEPCVVVDVNEGAGVSKKNMMMLLAHFGELMWVQQLEEGQSFSAEFYDSRSAQAAVNGLNGMTYNGVHITARLKDDHLSVQGTPPRLMPRSRSESAGLSLNSAPRFPQTTLTPTTPPYRPHNRDVFYSPASGSTVGSSRFTTPITPSSGGSYSPQHWRSGDCDPFITATPSSNKHRSLPAQLKITPGYTGSPGSGCESGPGYPYGYPRRFSDHGSMGGFSPMSWEAQDRKRIPEQNIVRKDRIFSGLDPRTTIMVKDVPQNKLSRNQLVEVLNSVVPGGFDFVYLRFDFRNCCNVGYAFVNFTSVKSLYEFHEAKVGKRWNMFSSDKVLQICYATIQGKEALINKFRNSAVMDVIEEWRPQIFYSSGSRQGLPEPFPGSDNAAQRHRSTSARLSSLAGPGSVHPQDTGEQYPYDFAPSAFDVGF